MPRCTPVAAVFIAGCASDGVETTRCPDGTYYGDGTGPPDEAADNVLDAADRATAEGSSIVHEEEDIIVDDLDPES